MTHISERKTQATQANALRCSSSHRPRFSVCGDREAAYLCTRHTASLYPGFFSWNHPQDAFLHFMFKFFSFRGIASIREQRSFYKLLLLTLFSPNIATFLLHFSLQDNAKVFALTFCLCRHHCPLLIKFIFHCGHLCF